MKEESRRRTRGVGRTKKSDLKEKENSGGTATPNWGKESQGQGTGTASDGDRGGRPEKGLKKEGKREKKRGGGGKTADVRSRDKRKVRPSSGPGGS